MPAPWTERLVAGSRRLLLAGLLAALATSGVSFWVARDDGRPTFRVAEPGTPTRIGAATWQLDRLTEVASLPGTYDASPPVINATFVIADLRADLTDVAEPASCLLYLRAGDHWFLSDARYEPADPAASGRCTAGRDGVVSAAFEVPLGLLDRVDGVRVLMAGEPATVLPGRLG